MIQPFYVFSDWGILVLRVVLGLILLVHGWPKIKNLQGTAGSFEMMGFKPGVFWGAIVAVVEFIGGLMLIFGFFTQIIAVAVAIQFLVIILKLKRQAKFVNSYEFDLLILAAALALVTLGAGAISVDRILGFVIY